MSSPTNSPIDALRSYKDLAPIFGKRNMAAALAARLVFAMLPLGILTAFTASSGNVAIGGMSAGIFSISVAIAAPVVGRAADIWGQQRVLFALVPLGTLALISLFYAARSGLQPPMLLVLCAFTGLTTLPVGTFCRARWASMNQGPKVLAPAFSYESMSDEIMYKVVGPGLVGIIASLINPAAPLLVAAGFMVLLGTGFALTSPKTLEVTTNKDALIKRPPIRTILLAVVPAAVTLICVGMIFGSTQAGVTARTNVLGIGTRAGLFYAVMGIGSALASLALVMLPHRFHFPARLMTLAAIGGVTLLFISSVTTALPTLLGLAVAGACFGPTMVTTFRTAQQLAPPGGVQVAMSLMQSSATIGLAIGTSTGGAVAAAHGPYAAFLIGASATLVIFAAGATLLLPRYLQRLSAG